ncbi:metal-dependent transcriptional regulator [Natrinema salsiterrestre]|uniref:Metal-dependent transcriptional regulator n=1 Tax=Natrinema salsiterrestre TaxID=2950540 RepID=A0A9Q4L940_9EURY|nr:metal-dependent transcriptional regulator [Natrinema salsiterrestre]MDF9747551.1 metal-dependent transcriptional regulator [Natrinema salsiterrestre]
MASAESSPESDETATLPDSLSSAAGWYLLTVYRLSSRDDRRVRTGELAERLAISPASVTEMAGKLADDSFLEYEPYAGVAVTPRGERTAESLAWRQCVVASFFDRILSYDIDGDTAYRIGYTVPEGGIRRLRERVDNPCLDTCRRVGREDDDCLVAARAEG